MASVDLKDAYYSIPILETDRKYLRFRWRENLYHFTCLPNGLSETPKKFTKILKAPCLHLRARGFANSAYIDDSALISDSFQGCEQNVYQTIQTMDSLGFTVHPEKSILIPQQILPYLGFILDSVQMKVTLTE